MSHQRRLRQRSVTHQRRLLAMVLTAALGLTAMLTQAPPAQADQAVTARNGAVTISGAGYGHGWGMSQWGAYGAATSGLTWRRILGFYYPGTTLQKSSTTHIRVQISADNDGDLRVLPSAGLRVYNVGSSASYTLPTGPGYTQWRMRRVANRYQLQYRTSAGTWVTRTAPRLDTTKAWRFDNTANVLSVVLPGGSVRLLRGQTGLVFTATSAITVNRLPLEQYVQGVVPAEMPTSWHLEAVKAQSVAARTYALRIKGVSGTTSYDICDTISCQVYRGMSAETTRGNQATAATAGYTVMYRGAVALTQFSASNGGARAKGGLPYLTAGADPYDGLLTDQSWSRPVTTAALTAAFPGIGTITRVQVTARDGSGQWGGRTVAVKLTGSTGTKTVDGASFRRALGLRSSLLTITAR